MHTKSLTSRNLLKMKSNAKMNVHGTSAALDRKITQIDRLREDLTRRTS